MSPTYRSTSTCCRTCSQKNLRPAKKRELVDYLGEKFSVSERRACRLVGLHRATKRYPARKELRTALRIRLRDLAMARPRFGYRRLHVLLRRDGWGCNVKLVHRLYREEGLGIRTKRRKKLAAQVRVLLPSASLPNERWSSDFVADTLVNGLRFRALTVVDLCSRECVAIEVARALPSEAVTRALDRAIAGRKKPAAITCDNGTEFTSRVFDAWAHERGIIIDYIRPGRPVENAFCESFNGRLRDECLNACWFETIDESRAGIEAWRVDYNEARPRSSLEGQTPLEYVAPIVRLACCLIAPSRPSKFPAADGPVSGSRSPIETVLTNFGPVFGAQVASALSFAQNSRLRRLPTCRESYLGSRFDTDLLLDGYEATPRLRSLGAAVARRIYDHPAGNPDLPNQPKPGLSNVRRFDGERK